MSTQAAWKPAGLTYARSITASQVNATTPTGFAGGGPVARVYNAGTVAVMVAFYVNANGAPTLAFPVDAAPPVGEPGTLVPPGTTVFVDGVAAADSFAAIGAAAGPSLIYVQKGDGNS